MSGDLFGSLGIDTGILIIILFVLVIILMILLIVTMTGLGNLKKRYERFMMGANARSMEEEIKNLFYDIDHLMKNTDENTREIKHIYRRLEGVYQKVGLIKYDAFNQMGGKLSFALALLDENNNGFLMNSVHSSDGNYCYIKEIVQGSSSIELSGDEQNALNQALSQSISPRISRSEQKASKARNVSDERISKKRESSSVKVKRKSSGRDDSEYDEESYEDEEAYDDSYEETENYDEQSSYDAYDEDDDPDLVEAEKVIASLSGRHRVIEEDDGGEGVISYTTGRRRKK